MDRRGCLVRALPRGEGVIGSKHCIPKELDTGQALLFVRMWRAKNDLLHLTYKVVQVAFSVCWIAELVDMRDNRRPQAV